MNAAAIIILILIGTFFIGSGVIKAQEGRRVVTASVRAYQIGGPRAAAIVAWLLPRLEIATGLALASSIAPVTGAGAAVLLLGVFSGAMASVLYRGITTSCGCHGSLSSSEVRPSLIIRNVVIMALTLGASYVRANSDPVGPQTDVIAAASAVVLAVLITAILERSAPSSATASTESRTV